MKPTTTTQFGDIYKAWDFCPLSEFAFFQEGPGLRKWQFTESGMKVINVGNIMLDGTVDTSNSSRHITLEEFESKYRHFKVESGDTVVSSSGWSYGKVGRIKPKHLPLMMNTSVIRFHPLSSHSLDANYLHYYLCSAFFERQIEAYIIGSHQPNFGSSHIKRMKIVVPPVLVQRKIGSILSAYDDLIENNTRRIAILESMAKAIYREWFVEFRFPGHENVKLVDSPLGKIPAGWKPTRLGDLAKEVRRGVNPSQVDPETPYFGLEHLPRKSITLGDWGQAKDVQSTKLSFNQGEILFGKIRPYFHKVGVAPVDGVCSSDAIVISPMTDESFGLVLCCVSSEDFVSHATQTSQGTKMPRANWNVLVKYALPTPNARLLERFNTSIRAIVSTLRVLMLKNRNLRKTRDLLLPKLISGQLDVEDLDIEIGEPLVGKEA